MNTTVVAGGMTGFVPRARLIRKRLSAGDAVIVSGWSGMEGTAILADYLTSVVCGWVEWSTGWIMD